MKMRGLPISCFILLFSMLSPAMTLGQEFVVARCDPSEGYAWFFKDPLFNPEPTGWMEDGLSNGGIILVRNGTEWNIQFSDIAGGFNYIADGATVLALSEQEGFIMIGAFHPNYSEIYTFDLVNAEVVWTSQKLGPLAPKVAVYRSQCGL